MLKPKLIVILLIAGAAIGTLIRLPKLVEKARIDFPAASPSDNRVSRNQNVAIENVSLDSEKVPEATAQSNLSAQPSAAVEREPGPQRDLPEPKVLAGRLGSVTTYREVRTDEGLVGIQILPVAESGALRATGLLPGDLLIAVNGVALEGSANSDLVMRSLIDTDSATATVVRNGRKLDIVVPRIP